MDFVAAQKVSKELARKFGAERWYRGVSLKVKPPEVTVQVAVDPMCKNLASAAIASVIDGVKVELTT